MRSKTMMMVALAVGLGVAATEAKGAGTPQDGAAKAAQTLAPQTSGDTLFQANGWQKNSPFFHFQNPGLIKQIRRQVLPLVSLEQRTPADGKVELDIVKDKKIEDLAGANASNISGSWKYPLTFQPGEKGPLCLEFDYEAVRTGTHPTRACVLLYYMRDGKTVTLRAKPIKLQDGKRASFRIPVAVLPETDGVQVHLRFDGCGKMTFINPRLFRAK